MLQDIYCKLPTDRDYRGRIDTDSEEESIIQQIRMVLGTRTGQVLGAPNFGIDLQDYLFSYNTSPDEIKALVNGAIGYYIKFDPKKYEVGCEVNFGKEAGGTSEYAVIDIYVNKKKCLGVLVPQES